MLNRYLLERKKIGASDFYIAGTIEARNMGDAMLRYGAELCDGDAVRISLLSVSLVLTGDRLMEATGRK